MIKTPAVNDLEPVDRFNYLGIWLNFSSFSQHRDFFHFKLTLKQKISNGPGKGISLLSMDFQVWYAFALVIVTSTMQLAL